MSNTGISCPRYLSRAQRFGGVMLNDLYLTMLPIGLFGVIMSKFISDLVIWPICLGLIVFSWTFLKATTSGKRDGKFRLWLHKNRLYHIRSFPRGVKAPIVYNSKLPLKKDGNPTMMKRRDPTKDISRVWGLGIESNKNKDEYSGPVYKLDGYGDESDILSVYAQYGVLQQRLFRLRVVRSFLLVAVLFMLYQIFQLTTIKRPSFYFKGMQVSGYTDVVYEKDFNRERWLEGSGKDGREMKSNF